MTMKDQRQTLELDDLAAAEDEAAALMRTGNVEQARRQYTALADRYAQLNMFEAAGYMYRYAGDERRSQDQFLLEADHAVRAERWKSAALMFGLAGRFEEVPEMLRRSGTGLVF